MLDGSHVKAVNRRNRGAMCKCVRGAGCAICVCRPKAHGTATTLLTDRPRVQEIKQHTEHPRQHAPVVDNAHRTAVSSMSHLYPANPPPHDFAGLRRSLALALPRQTGHAFDER